MRISVRPQGHGSGSSVTASATWRRISGWVRLVRLVIEQPRPGLSGGHGPAVLVDVLDDRHVLEQVDARAPVALGAPQAFGRPVEIEGPHAERLLDARRHRRRAPFAVGGHRFGADAQPARELLLREQHRERGVGVDELWLEAVELLDQPRERERDRQREHAVQPDVYGLRDASAHVRRRGGAERGHAQPARHPRAHADHRVVAQELCDQRAPCRAVVDEQALTARGSAGGHRPVAAQVQGITGQRFDVREQLVTAQARVGHELVEAFHQRRLLERRQPSQLDRAGQSADPLAVEGRVRDCVAHELVKALLLKAGKALARPALALRELARQPGAGGEVSQSLALIAERHRRLSTWRPARARSSRNKRLIRCPSRSSTRSGRVRRSSESPSCME